MFVYKLSLILKLTGLKWRVIGVHIDVILCCKFCGGWQIIVVLYLIEEKNIKKEREKEDEVEEQAENTSRKLE